MTTLYHCGFQEYWRRQIGDIQNLAFARKIGGCEDLIRRFSLYAELDCGHLGCVNTVHFNPSGEILVSGYYLGRDICFWDWAAKLKRLSFSSGHEDKVFQARIMPFSDDRIVISCAADGQVRQADVLEGGLVETKQLAQHRGQVRKLAIEPGSSRVFMSCGKDGIIRHFDLRDGNNKTTFQCYTLTGSSKIRRHPVRLNSVVINSRNPNYFAVGGSDKYARVYDIRKVHWGDQNGYDSPVYSLFPAHMQSKDSVHITALAYSFQEELLVTYNDEHIYLFDKMYNQSTSEGEKGGVPTDELQVYKGHRNEATDVSFLGPNSEYVVSGSGCGNIFIWRKKGAKLVALFQGDIRIVKCLEPHPHVTVLATSGLEDTAKIWAPIAEDYVPLPQDADEIMKANQAAREDHSPYLSDSTHVENLQRCHVQPEIARWLRQREGDRSMQSDGNGDADAEGNSDNDDFTMDDYLSVLCITAGASDEEEDDTISTRDCRVS